MANIWECWRSESTGETTFAPATNVRRFLMMPEDAVHLYSVRAGTYNEAMTAYHEIQEWEPYVPMSED